MKLVKNMVIGLFTVLAVCLIVSCASQGSSKTYSAEEKGVIESAFLAVIEGLTESTEEAREIQRQLTLQQQQTFLERHQNATTENDEALKAVKDAVGVKGKLSQILTNIKDYTKIVQEREQARKKEIDERTTSVNPYAQARQDIQENKSSN